MEDALITPRTYRQPPTASLGCVNLAEVLQKAEQHGVETEGLEYDLEALGIEFRDFDRYIKSTEVGAVPSCSSTA